MYRLMVRSTDGWFFTDGSGGPQWRPNYVWSTWSRYSTYEEAHDQEVEFDRGRQVSLVIAEYEYPAFCAANPVV